jgi:hypothetical protein
MWDIGGQESLRASWTSYYAQAKVCEWMDRCMHGWMGGWMGGWMVGWMDGWMDKKVDGRFSVFLFMFDSCTITTTVTTCSSDGFPFFPHTTKCLILVIDSTDRDRLPVVREELHKMLANEVCMFCLYVFMCVCGGFVCSMYVCMYYVCTMYVCMYVCMYYVCIYVCIREQYAEV